MTTKIISLDRDALAHNVEQLAACIPDGQLMPMVKSNGYGAGMTELTRALLDCGVCRFGVAHLSELRELRAAGIDAPVFVTAVHASEVAEAVALGSEPAVGTLDGLQALALEAKRVDQRQPFHLWLNTGMNRFGAAHETAAQLIEAIETYRDSLELIGVGTHLSCADMPDQDAFTQQQLDTFYSIADDLACPMKHVANSAALLRFGALGCDVARPGLAILGVHPASSTRECAELKPLLTIQAPIIQINTVAAGEGVGYMRHYRTQREIERIGVIPVGYHEGCSRSWSGRGYVLVNGVRAPRVGVVCMNHQMIDLTDISDVKLGDLATLSSPELPFETVAQHVGCIPHELVALGVS